MLKLFSSKKRVKEAKPEDSTGADTTMNNSQSTNAVNVPASACSGTDHDNTQPPSAVALRSGAPANDASTYNGNDRNSNYSCLSADSDSYIPRQFSGPLKPGNLLRRQQPSAGIPAGSDAPDAVVSAMRYVYDTTSRQWTSQNVGLRIMHPNRGISQDDFHVYFACDLLLLREADKDGNREDALATATGAGASDAEARGILKKIPMVARMYRHNVKDVTDDDYFGCGQAQAVAESLAYQFSRFPVAPGARHVPLPLLTNRNVCRIKTTALPEELRGQTKGFFSYGMRGSRDILMLLEPDVRECKAVGVSFSMNVPASHLLEVANGTGDRKGSESTQQCQEDDVYPPFDTSLYDKQDLKDVAEAFSHFSFQQFKGKLMVHGLLTSHHYLVDPLVYTEDQQGFGMGNDGPKAIQRWRQRHRCNEICRAYDLEPVNDLAPSPSRLVATLVSAPHADAAAASAQKDKDKRRHRLPLFGHRKADKDATAGEKKAEKDSAQKEKKTKPA